MGSRRRRCPICCQGNLNSMTGIPYYLPQPDKEHFPLWLRLWIFLSVSWPVQMCVWLSYSALSFFLPPPRRFVIVTSPRSGSTMLLNMLNGHSSICCHGEFLNRAQTVYGNVLDSTLERQKLHVRAVFAWPYLRSLLPFFQKPQSVGGKIFLEHLYCGNIPFDKVLEWLDNPFVIVLYREDMLATYTSLRIAFVTGEWYRDGRFNGEIRGSGGSSSSSGHSSSESGDSSNKKKVVVELTREKYLEECAFQKEQWDAVLRSLKIYKRSKVFLISYEELSRDLDVQITRLYNFLGLLPPKEGPTHTVGPPSQRQNPFVPADLISNFASSGLDFLSPEESFLKLSLD